jgi:pilus assembly protein CpaC
MSRNLEIARRIKKAVAVSLVWIAVVGSPPAQAQSDHGSGGTVVRTLNATVGKSSVLQLPMPATRVAIADPAVADVVLLGPQEVYVLGKTVGNTNLTTWSNGGRADAINVNVTLDTATVQEQLRKLVSGAEAVEVSAAGSALVLTGLVADAVKVQQVLELAQGFAPKRIVNLLRVNDPQQVMLEVKVAEISRTLLDKLGAEFQFSTRGSTRIGIISQLLTQADSVLFGVRADDRSVAIDAEKRDQLVKVLAEPTILAISGQEGSFLAGGRIFIPIPQGSSGNVAQYVLHEKEFGIRLRFTPTVLEGGKIHLKVAPEVSEVSQSGLRVTASGAPPTIIPAITTREVSTTVQLRDGESLAIGGLIKNNATANVKALPFLGEIPVLGALFRSTEFQTDRTELLFIVTPRLAEGGKRDYPLPTDAHRDPSRADIYLRGRTESTGSEDPERQPRTRNEIHEHVLQDPSS